MGDMTDHIMWANGGTPFDDIDESPFENDKSVMCKHCGENGLHWTDFKGKWYLFNQRCERHVCTKQNAIDVFKEVI